jgi:hypothetical protein
VAGAATATLKDAALFGGAALVGVNVTSIVQLAPIAKLAGSVPQLLVWLNWPGLAPPSAILLMISGAVPVFVTVTGCDGVATCNVELKVRLSGNTVFTGAMPVPLSDIVWELVGSESVIVTDPVCGPGAVGLNLT